MNKTKHVKNKQLIELINLSVITTNGQTQLTQLARNGRNMINIVLIKTKMISSKWFHWYEGSSQHTIWWYLYIGIDNELMECLLNQLTKIYLSEHD